MKRIARESLPEIVAALVAAFLLAEFPSVREWLWNWLSKPATFYVGQLLLGLAVSLAVGGFGVFLYLKGDLQVGKLDRLTTAWNAGQIDPFLEKRLHEARNKGASFAVLLVDIDNFKGINDTYDHEVGNHILAELVTIIRPRSKGEEIFRYGGDEFLILTNVGIDTQGCWGYGKRVVRDVAAYEFLGRVNSLDAVKLTVSCGCFLAAGSDNVARIRDDVVLALKKAKSSDAGASAGKNTAYVYTPSDEQSRAGSLVASRAAS